MIATATTSPGPHRPRPARRFPWHESALGPWTRHRRDLPGTCRYLTVTPARGGGWTWDLRGSGGSSLLRAPRSATAARAAKAAAVRAAATLADACLATFDEIGDFRGIGPLSPVSVSAGKRCCGCRLPITDDVAAADRDGWLWCAQCACRIPGIAVAGAGPCAL
jgi:hypothetical protein